MTILSSLAATAQLFFERAGAKLDRAAADRVLAGALQGTDDGELFLEYRESEMISLDDGVIRSASFASSMAAASRSGEGTRRGMLQTFRRTASGTSFVRVCERPSSTFTATAARGIRMIRMW